MLAPVRTMEELLSINAQMFQPGGVFEGATEESQLKKLREEVQEFLENPSLEEASDILVVLGGWMGLRRHTPQDFREAFGSKITRNALRRWRLRSDGTFKHE